MRAQAPFRIALSAIFLSVLNGCGDLVGDTTNTAKCGDQVAGVWVSEEAWADNEWGQALTLLPGGKAFLDSYSIRYPNAVGASRRTGTWSADGAEVTTTLSRRSSYDLRTGWDATTTEIKPSQLLVLTISGNEAKATDDGRATDPFVRGTTCGGDTPPNDAMLLGTWEYQKSKTELIRYRFKIDGTVELWNDNLATLQYRSYKGTWVAQKGTVVMTWTSAGNLISSESKDIPIPEPTTLAYSSVDAENILLGGNAAYRDKLSGGSGD
ncbi:MAG: hypothetical protein IPK50_06775 [Fibrobacterota bacterium]|nr:MAG: hypothetical protein IPK50_06775 [Fibrobacterota bacterium]